MKQLLVAALIGVLAGPAYATCAPTEDMRKTLSSERWKEQLAAVAHVGKDGKKILELWRNPDADTWTIIITDVTGMSCMKASGTGWHERIIFPGEPA